MKLDKSFQNDVKIKIHKKNPGDINYPIITSASPTTKMVEDKPFEEELCNVKCLKLQS